MNFRSQTVFIFFLQLFCNYIYAQRIDKSINDYANLYPFEQTYLQLDNSLYSAGDTVWFKAYVLQNSLPSLLSTNLYVDWFDASGKLLTHQVYPIQSATANGQFVVPSTYKEQKIHLLAYTKWMLNSDTDFLFHKDINILPFKSQTFIPQKAETQKTVLQFFPEGGNLVAGIINKVAFKATDQYGNPIDLSGTIKDNHDDSVASFTTMHEGMGYLYLIPKERTNYIAEYDSSKPFVNLPQTQSSGIAMETVLDRDKRKVIIRKNGNYNHIHLLATINGTVSYLSNISLSTKDSMASTVPVSTLPSGILTITVLDNDWNPLAERVCFVRGKDIYSNIPQLSIIKQNFDKKGLNTIQLNYNDTLSANLSIAITDGKIPTDTTDNIISYLLLTGQLKGKINNPAYYFEDISFQRQQQLDLVMLTNGWRRYNWHAIAANEHPIIKYPRDSAYFFLDGKITDRKTKLPQQLSFMIKSKEMFGIYNFPMNGDGSFFDSSVLIYDTTSIVYKPGKGQKTYEFAYSKLPDISFNKYPFEINTFQTKAEQKILLGSLDFYKTTLPDVTVTTFKTQYDTPTDSLEAQYESPLFANAPTLKNVYVLNDPILPAYGADLRGFILARLHILVNPSDKGQASLTFFVDGVQMPTDAALQTSIVDIVFMKYYKYFVGASGGGGAAGVIALWTKQGFPSEYYTKGTKVSTPKIIGYTVSKEFYLPDYDTVKNKDAVNDRRKTLYWNPQINLNNKENKNIDLSFYNNDFAKSFRIIIEGIKIDGTPIHIEKMIE